MTGMRMAYPHLLDMHIAFPAIPAKGMDRLASKLVAVLEVIEIKRRNGGTAIGTNNPAAAEPLDPVHQ